MATDEIVAAFAEFDGDGFERAPDFGDRAWMLKGKKLTVIINDDGNSYCHVISVYPTKAKNRKVKDIFAIVKPFFQRIDEYYSTEGVEDGEEADDELIEKIIKKYPLKI